MMRNSLTLIAAGLLALSGALGGQSQPSAAAGCEPAASQPAASTGQPAKAGPHAYFEALRARPDCMRAYSLREQQQVLQYKHSRNRPPAVTYDPAADTDPRRQDAAKIVVPEGKVSLPNQLRLPIGTTDGTSTLITWDAWFGAEFRYANTAIGNYKTFQFASPKTRIWFEVRTRFSLEEGGNRRQSRSAKGPAIARAAMPGDYIGMVDARAYGKKGEMQLGPNVTKPAPLSPMAGSFTIRPETWTRYWVLFEQHAGDWDLVSLWVADENNDPVRLLDRRQLTVDKSVDEFWLEYNTSSNQRPKGRGPLVAYARNVAMLRNVQDVPALLKRPVK